MGHPGTADVGAPEGRGIVESPTPGVQHVANAGEELLCCERLTKEAGVPGPQALLQSLDWPPAHEKAQVAFNQPLAPMPGVGIEPTWDFSRGILSPLRLPFRHPG